MRRSSQRLQAIEKELGSPQLHHRLPEGSGFPCREEKKGAGSWDHFTSSAPRLWEHLPVEHEVWSVLVPRGSLLAGTGDARRCSRASSSTVLPAPLGAELQEQKGNVTHGTVRGHQRDRCQPPELS